MNVLGTAGKQAFQNRQIDPAIASHSGVYTGSSVTNDAGETVVVPDPKGNIVVFPFVDGGQAVGEKYRAPGKRFWQRRGGRKTFWNADCMDDPALEAGTKSLVITEGEIDALTAIDCGLTCTVSVPDGAPAVRDGETPEDIPETDPADDATGKFEFVFNNRHRIKRIKRFVLAVDNDAPGRRLAAELLRRLGAARCSFVTYPEGCKDLNDVRVNHGPDAVVRVIADAKPYPVKGVYQLSDYPELDEPRTYSTGWPDLDDNLRLWLGELLVITGIPGHGKSTWTLNMCVNPKNIWASMNLRESPIAMMAAKKHLDQHQVEAAIEFRRLWEALGGAGAGSFDYAREPVDGGGPREPITERQIDAGFKLDKARKHIGLRSFGIVEKVAGEGVPIARLGSSHREKTTLADYLKNALDDLAELWELRTKKKRPLANL